jgi:hypothetical protein
VHDFGQIFRLLLSDQVMTMVTHNAEGIEAKIKLNQRLFDGIEKHLPKVSMTQL